MHLVSVMRSVLGCSSEDMLEGGGDAATSIRTFSDARVRAKRLRATPAAALTFRACDSEHE